MSDGIKNNFVTRSEFYGALVVIWLYIMVVLGDLMRLQEQWTTGILWAASLLMMVVYGVLAFNARQAKAAGPAAPLSERAKQLASDPAQKLEAIKARREETGAGLAEAKEAVEAYIAKKEKDA
jgi:ribosomal protein L7/L12